LINEIGLKEVTVSNLSEKADINRGTFYLHYKNIDDLVDTLQADIMKDMYQVTKHLDPNDIIHNKNNLTPLLVNITKRVANKSDIIRALVSSKGTPSFRITWEQIVSNLVFEKINEVDSAVYKYNISENYVAVLIASIYTSTILEWIETGMKESPEEIAHFISEFGIQPIIGKYA